MTNPCREALGIKMEPEVYLIKSEDSLDNETFDFFLSFADEKRKAKILRQKQRKKAELKLLSENLAKYAVKKSFGIDIKKQNIAYTKLGKPYLLGYPDIHFSISHSGDYIACAVFESKVGIDIEWVGEYKEKLARRVCSKSELEQIEKAKDKALEFTKLWTKKEAYLKFLGTGIQTFNFKNVLDDMKNNILTEVYDGYVITIIY